MSGWMLRQAMADLSPALLMVEVEFRLRQTPYQHYFHQKMLAQKYAASIAKRLIWC